MMGVKKNCSKKKQNNNIYVQIDFDACFPFLMLLLLLFLSFCFSFLGSGGKLAAMMIAFRWSMLLMMMMMMVWCQAMRHKQTTNGFHLAISRKRKTDFFCFCFVWSGLVNRVWLAGRSCEYKPIDINNLSDHMIYFHVCACVFVFDNYFQDSNYSKLFNNYFNLYLSRICYPIFFFIGEFIFKFSI